MDGVNDYVSLGDNFNYERTTAWTWSFWYRPKTLTGNHTLYARATSSSVGIYFQVVANGRLVVNLRNTNSTNHLSVNSPAGSIIPNTWYHIVVTYDGSSLNTGVKIYLNGTNQTLTTISNTLTSSILSPSSTAMFGQILGANFCDGYMDEVSHWNRVLTQAEVTEMFNNGKPTDLSVHSAYASALLDWWRMGDSDTYPIIADKKGTVHGTLTNGVSSTIEAFAP